MPTTGLPRLAVLIDAEYVTANFAAPMFDELTAYGAVTVRRAYGDWSSAQLAGWTYKLETHAITPVQRFAGSAGRSSAVSAIVIDALDLLHAGRIDGLAIVCNDGSFTPLATRLRESGATVVGLGRAGTAQAFMAACDDYVDLDKLAVDDPVTPGAQRDGAGPAAPPGPPGPAAQPARPRTPTQAQAQAQAQAQVTQAQVPQAQAAQGQVTGSAQQSANPQSTYSPGRRATQPPVSSAPDHLPGHLPDHLPDLMSDTLPTQRRDPVPAYTGKHRA